MSTTIILGEDMPEPDLSGCIPFAESIHCLYGDPLCPCQDGDACHYEGENPLKICGNCACWDMGVVVDHLDKGKCRNHGHVADSLDFCPEWLRAG